MAVTVDTQPCGEPALAALAARVRMAQADDPLAPVTVVVSDLLTGVSVRRELGRRQGVSNVTFSTIAKLAHDLGEPLLAATGRRRITSIVLHALAAETLRDSGRLDDISEHRSAGETLVRLYEEARVNPSASSEVLTGTGSTRRIWTGLTRSLAGRLAEYYDLADVIGEIESAGATSDSLDSHGPIIVHMPRSLSEVEARLLRYLGDRSDVIIIAGVVEEESANRSLLELVEQLGESVDMSAGPTAASPAHTTTVSVTDSDAECHHVVRELLAWREGTGDGGGIPFEDMVVVYPVRTPYRAALAKHLRAAGIPFNAPSDRTAASSMTGRLLFRLLDIHDQGYPRQAVIDLFACAPLRRDEDRLIPSGRWDRLSRRRGVIGGVAQWTTRLAAHGGESAELAEFMGGFIALTTPPEDNTWTAFSEWVTTMLTALIPQYRHGWPEREQDAYELILASAERLGLLDGTCASPGVSQRRTILESELEVPLRRQGRLGDGVSIGPLGSLSAVPARASVVVGCIEGYLPAVHGPGGPLDPPRSPVEDHHRDFLTRAASTSDAILLTMPRADLLRRRTNAPSRWLSPWLTSGHPDLCQASQLSGVVDSAVAASENDYVASMMWSEPDPAFAPAAHADPNLSWGLEARLHRECGHFGRFNGLIPGLVPLPTADPISASRIQDFAKCPFSYLLKNVLGLRPSDAPEEIESISPMDMGNLVHRILEKFLLEKITEAEVPPPDVAWNDAAHRRLDEISAELFDVAETEGVVGRPQVWLTTKDQIRVELHELLCRDDAQRSEFRSTPIAVEAPFGDMAGSSAFGDGHDLNDQFYLRTPSVDVGADRAPLNFRGVVDRIDECETESGRSFMVIDYKTGRPESEKNIRAKLPTGTAIQLPIYASAVRLGFRTDDGGETPRRVTSSYWYCTERGKYSLVGLDLDEVEGEFEAAMSAISDAMAGGVYVARPGPDTTWPRPTFENCTFCDFDRLCPSSRGAEWEVCTSDQSVPEPVAVYVELTEAGVDR